MGVNLIFGDITKLKVDAIVNVINCELEDGGIVNDAIHTAAGPALKAYRNMLKYCPVGEAKLTPGFKLPAWFLIHTVAPLWRDGDEREELWLSSCYQRSLGLAVQYQCNSIAIPVFSASSSDFPLEKALQIAYDTCQYYITKHNIEMEIFIVLYGGTLYSKDADDAAGQLFRHVEEYVQNHYQLEEDIKENLQLAETAKPYYPESPFAREVELPGGGVLIVQPRGAVVHYSISSRPSGPTDIPDKKEFVVEDSFTQKLLRYMDAKNMTPPMLYNEAGYDRKFFSKIQSDPDYHPRKYTVVRFALALKLDLEETDDLLNAAGFALSRSMIKDLAIEYCIRHNMRSVWEVNNLLQSIGLEAI